MTRPPRIEITLVAALSVDGVIGTGHGGIPWKLPRDAAHFRASVAGKSVLLGRRTYEEMHGWFRDERPIILTSDRSFHPREKEIRVAHALDQALEIASVDGGTEIMVCGGASVYTQALPLASRMILTHVATHSTERYPDGARFPTFDPDEWLVEREEAYDADRENAHAMLMVWYRRRNPPAVIAINAGNAGNR